MKNRKMPLFGGDVKRPRAFDSTRRPPTPLTFGLYLMNGSVADVRAGVQAAAAEARRRGLLVSEVVIPRPSRELFADYL